MTVETYDHDANCCRWPDLDGAYAVGTLEFELTDPLRAALYAPAPTPERRLYVRGWYPAIAADDRPVRPYFTEAEGTSVAARSLQLLGQPADAFRNATRLLTHSRVGAAPASGRFPVIVYNHGFLSYPAQHTALFEHLAAHGYVVLSVGHPWESGGLVYPNGDVLLASPRILEDMMRIGKALGAMAAYASPTLAAQLDALQHYIQVLRTTAAGQLAPAWRDDAYFVLDRLEHGEVPAAALLSPILDHARRGYMGKSFGAYVGGMLAQGDRRARGVVHLDGGAWSYELVDTELRTPFVTLSSDLWEDVRHLPELPPGMDPSVRAPVSPKTPTGSDLAYESIARAGLRPDGYRFIVPGIRHSGVSDAPELAGTPALRAKLGTEEALATFTTIQNAFVRGFLDRHVKGDDTSTYPTRERARFPGVIVQDLGWLRERARTEVQ